jgi:hypothetical protein
MPSVDGLQFQTGFTGLQDVDIERYLGKKFTDDENDKANGFIKAAEYELASRTHRNFDYNATYFEYFDGMQVELEPRNTPIVSLSGITINGIDSTIQYNLNNNYWVYDNYFVFSNAIGVWGVPYKAVKIEYKIRQFWGEDIIQAVKQRAASEFLKSENGGVALNAFSFSGLSQQFNVSEFNKQWDDLIFRYTNFSL